MALEPSALGKAEDLDHSTSQGHALGSARRSFPCSCACQSQRGEMRMGWELDLP